MGLLKSLGILGIALLVSYNAEANRVVGQAEAARICDKIISSRDRMACIDEVRHGNTFDQRALNVCSSILSSSQITECIRSVRNKDYEDFETRECARQITDRNKVSCLARFGRTNYHRPPMFPQPPHYGGGGHPGYGSGNIYGPAVTRRWMSLGEEKVDKVEIPRTISLRGQLVNEITLSVTKERVQVNSVIAHLSNGQLISVYGLNGTIREGQQRRARLDLRGSVRVDRIEINAISGLIGSRGVMRVDVGLAQ